MTALEPTPEEVALAAAREPGPEAHPEFAGESAHLARTVDAIETYLGEAPLLRAGDEISRRALEVHVALRRVALRDALDEPYFGRVDFDPLGPEGGAPEGGGVPGSGGPEGGGAPSGGGASETYYIGRTHVDLEGVAVTGWQAPVAALFYRGTAAEARYWAPGGEVQGALRLKRRLVVAQRALAQIADEVDTRPQVAGARRRALAAGAAGAVADDFLRAVLSEAASSQLRDIVATIQAQQYDLIAADPSQVLVVQGVAGSGKTSIALHRLSFLLYPALAAGKPPPRCIVFGPNRLFLRYVSGVLPRLGLQSIAQTTLADWALARMNLDHMRLADQTFEALLSPALGSAERESLIRRSRLKTSRRTGALLERYVERRRRQVEIPEQGWVVPVPAGALRVEVRLPAADLRARHERGLGRPFALHRAAFLEDVLTMADARYEAAVEAAVEAQLAAGRRRLQAAEEGRPAAAGDWRARASLPLPVTRRGVAPFPPGRPTGNSRGRDAASEPYFDTPQTRGAPPGRPARDDALLRQTLRSLEQSAHRRRGEGEALIREAEAARAAALSAGGREQFWKTARVEVQRLLDRCWPPVNALADYFALVADGALLQELGEGLFDEEELGLLWGSAHRAGGAVDATDLPAIHHLFTLTQTERGMAAGARGDHDHVVLDEAQDVSELELCTLRLLEPKRSFTILGDLAQGIYGHRGLTSWSQVEAVFGHHAYAECAISYRTTAEITELANRVLAPAADPVWATDPVPGGRPGGRPGGQPAVPFGRHGPAPSLVHAEDEDALVAAVAQAVAGAQRHGHRNVAVIARTAAHARALGERLRRAERPEVAAIAIAESGDFDYQGGAVVLPVWLAKGLEFDAAVVAGADAQTYPNTAFDRRLLYVALTRPMHELHVVWTGDLTPHLTAAVSPAAAATA